MKSKSSSNNVAAAPWALDGSSKVAMADDALAMMCKNYLFAYGKDQSFAWTHMITWMAMYPQGGPPSNQVEWRQPLQESNS